MAGACRGRSAVRLGLILRLDFHFTALKISFPSTAPDFQSVFTQSWDHDIILLSLSLSYFVNIFLCLLNFNQSVSYPFNYFFIYLKKILNQIFSHVSVHTLVCFVFLKICLQILSYYKNHVQIMRFILPFVKKKLSIHLKTFYERAHPLPRFILPKSL